MIKNPESKTKREKKKTKNKGEDEDEEEKEDIKNTEIKNRNIEFMKIFQKKEEKVSDLKKKKKKKKKTKGDIEKMADELVEKEYAKLDGFNEVDDLDNDEEIGIENDE